MESYALNDQDDWTFAKLFAENLVSNSFKNEDELKKAYCNYVATKESNVLVLNYPEALMNLSNLVKKQLYNHLYSNINLVKVFSKEQFREAFLENSYYSSLDELAKKYFTDLDNLIAKNNVNNLTVAEKKVFNRLSLGLEIYGLTDNEKINNLGYFCPGCNLVYAGSPKFELEKIKQQPCCGNEGYTLEARCEENHLLYKKQNTNHNGLEYI
jgi:hypothetical protein